MRFVALAGAAGLFACDRSRPVEDSAATAIAGVRMDSAFAAGFRPDASNCALFRADVSIFLECSLLFSEAPLATVGTRIDLVVVRPRVGPFVLDSFRYITVEREAAWMAVTSRDERGFRRAESFPSFAGSITITHLDPINRAVALRFGGDLSVTSRARVGARIVFPPVGAEIIRLRDGFARIPLREPE